MSIQERREKDKEIVKQKILQAAREMFIKEGYESVSMRKIARKINYSPTTIYLYFKDKSDLLFQICEETFSKMIPEFQALEKKFKDPLEHLMESARAYIHFGLNHPHHYKITFIEMHGDINDSQKYAGSLGAQTFQFLYKAVEECIRQKRFRPVDPLATSQVLWSQVHGITSLLIVHPHFPWIDKETLINHMLDISFSGLKP